MFGCMVNNGMLGDRKSFNVWLDLCVLFGRVTVETAEEQDHWKAAHS